MFDFIDAVVEEFSRGLSKVLLFVIPLIILGIWKAIEIIVGLFQHVV